MIYILHTDIARCYIRIYNIIWCLFIKMVEKCTSSIIFECIMFTIAKTLKYQITRIFPVLQIIYPVFSNLLPFCCLLVARIPIPRVVSTTRSTNITCATTQEKKTITINNHATSTNHHYYQAFVEIQRRCTVNSFSIVAVHDAFWRKFEMFIEIMWWKYNLYLYSWNSYKYLWEAFGFQSSRKWRMPWFFY